MTHIGEQKTELPLGVTRHIYWIPFPLALQSTTWRLPPAPHHRHRPNTTPWRASRPCSTGVTATALVDTRAAAAGAVAATTVTVAASRHSCPAFWAWVWYQDLGLGTGHRHRRSPPTSSCQRHRRQCHPKCTTIIIIISKAAATAPPIPIPIQAPNPIPIQMPGRITATTTLSDPWTRSWSGRGDSVAKWPRTIQKCTIPKYRSAWAPSGNCSPKDRSVHSSTRQNDCGKYHSHFEGGD